MKFKRNFGKALLVSTCALAAGAVSAGELDLMLEEIVVTATKRAQSTQDIPMSVEAVSGEKLSAMGIDNIQDLSATVPNFSVGESMTTNNVTMRGMGSGSDRSFEQSVSMFVDGIYMPRSRQTRSPFFDADRVEVLKGPQAVLFGLNSTAGAVSIHNAKNSPGDAFDAEVSAEYETEYAGVATTVVLGGGISETVGVRLAVKYSDSGDGFIENDVAGDVSSSEQTLARITLVWEPTTDLSVTAKYDFSEYESTGSPGELTATNALGEIVGAVGGVTDLKLNHKSETSGRLFSLFDPDWASHLGTSDDSLQRTQNAAVNVDWQLSEHTLTANLGYSDYFISLPVDVDAGPLDGWDANNYEEYDQFSSEIRIASPTGQTLEYIAGIYYQTANLFSATANVGELDDLFCALAAFGPACASAQQGINTSTFIDPTFSSAIQRTFYPFEQKSTLWSAFVSVTWNISDTLRVIGGVRTTDENKKADLLEHMTESSFDGGNSWLPTNVGLFSVPNLAPASGIDRDSDNVMPELMVQYDLDSSTMVYAKYGESAKSGGLTSVLETPEEFREFDDESVKGMELGLKSSLAGGAAELNIALFRNEFADLQVKSTLVDGINVTTLVDNAGEVTSQGIEVDGRWKLAEWLVVGGSAAWLDATYDKYDAGPCNTSGSTKAGTIAGTCDLAGENLPFAADVTGNIFADISLPLNEQLEFVAGLNVSYSDDYTTQGNLEPATGQDAYTKVGGRIGVNSVDGKWSVNLIGKNLTDEEIITGSQTLGVLDAVYLQAPRTFVLQGVYRFGH